MKPSLYSVVPPGTSRLIEVQAATSPLAIGHTVHELAKTGQRARSGWWVVFHQGKAVLEGQISSEELRELANRASVGYLADPNYPSQRRINE